VNKQPAQAGKLIANFNEGDWLGEKHVFKFV
jgi:hypothetical protein